MRGCGHRCPRADHHQLPTHAAHEHGLNGVGKHCSMESSDSPVITNDSEMACTLWANAHMRTPEGCRRGLDMEHAAAPKLQARCTAYPEGASAAIVVPTSRSTQKPMPTTMAKYLGDVFIRGRCHMLVPPYPDTTIIGLMLTPCSGNHSDPASPAPRTSRSQVHPPCAN